MIQVKATTVSKDKNIIIKELGRVAEYGEIFEISEDRLDVLQGNNPYEARFITLLPKQEVPEEVQEKPKRTYRKKKVE